MLSNRGVCNMLNKPHETLRFIVLNDLSFSVIATLPLHLSIFASVPAAVGTRVRGQIGMFPHCKSG